VEIVAYRGLPEGRIRELSGEFSPAEKCQSPIPIRDARFTWVWAYRSRLFWRGEVFSHSTLCSNSTS